MSFDRLQCFDRSRGPADFSAAITSLENNFAVGDVRLLDAAGRVLLKLERLRLRRVPRDWLARLVSGPLPNWCYELAWVPQPLEASPAGQNPAEPGHWLIFDSQEGLGRPWPSGWLPRAKFAADWPPMAIPNLRRRPCASSSRAASPAVAESCISPAPM